MRATSGKSAMLSGRAVHRRLAVAAQPAAEDFVRPTKAVGEMRNHVATPHFLAWRSYRFDQRPSSARATASR